jgi:high affinity choline transporter 7
MTLAAVGVLYAAFLAVGWFAARRVKHMTAAEMMVAGRAMPLWIATLTMTATWVDGGYLLGTAEGAFKSSIESGLQGGVCYGISLIVGGVFFARTMRRHGFNTLIDPFEARFGKVWASVLFLPAMLGEVFWGAELLVAIGSTFGVLLGMDLRTAIIVSAVVVTAYTVTGGIWSVAYTDVFQLGLVAVGVVAAIPAMLAATGGLAGAFSAFAAARPDRAGFLPPAHATSFWSGPAIISWWDISLMLVFGGIPWNCYFQRVLSCKTPGRAQAHSILAGLLTIAFTIPPLILGVAAFSYPWPADLLAQLQQQPARTLPLIFRYVTPPLISFLGLGAIIGAVTSSFSASILSAGSMFSWNCCYRLLRPDLSELQIRRLIRGSIVMLGAASAVLALKVQSVQALWFFTSDLVFVLLFPQLLYALFDSRVNRTGSVVAFIVSLAIRLGGGEPLLNIPALIPYPELFAALLPGDPSAWYEPGTHAMLFPYKTLAAIAGLVLLPVVSRASAAADAPRPLRNMSEAAAA